MEATFLFKNKQTGVYDVYKFIYSKKHGYILVTMHGKKVPNKKYYLGVGKDIKPYLQSISVDAKKLIAGSIYNCIGSNIFEEIQIIYETLLEEDVVFRLTLESNEPNDNNTVTKYTRKKIKTFLEVIYQDISESAYNTMDRKRSEKNANRYKSNKKK